MPDESKEIGKIGFDSSGESTNREPIIIKLSSYRNAKFIDIRKYYEEQGEWKPTKKGITMNNEQLNEFLKIIKNNENEINNWFKTEE